MPIVKHDVVTDDVWLPLDGRDPANINWSGPVLFSLDEWKTHKDVTTDRFERIGVTLAPDDSVEAIADGLHRLEVVCLHFPKFNDGRAFSQARLLRERYGFAGEIRATGHIIQDLFLFLQRSGVDAVAVDDPSLAAAWGAARRRFVGYYQPAFDTAPVATRTGSQDVPVWPLAATTESSTTAAGIWAY